MARFKHLFPAMRVYRLVLADQEKEAFSGKGEGRWKTPDVRVVDCASSRSLTILELAMHLTQDAAQQDYVMIEAQLPDEYVHRLASEDLPEDWDQREHPQSTRDLGEAWALSKRSLGLAVPSVVVPEEFNILLNPEHPCFSEVVINKGKPYTIDPRLKDPQGG